ncbi:MAG: histone deacetylase [Proteobacteria bacterium]|nr:histone deacetylase [Pseudomonadota bacterium]
MSRTSVFYDDICTFHQMGYLHPESPKRLQSIRQVLYGDGVGRELAKLPPRDAAEEELAWVHDRDYIRRIKDTDGVAEVNLDPDTSANAYTWKASLRAAGGFLACVESVKGGGCINSFAFVRPPGHHAERGRAMGFCIFNNVAIGAEWLLRKGGAERVAIVDFDIHHGNGTQHSFYDRGDVFFASVHRFPFYPGTGAADETGSGKGRGATLNVPLPAGSGDDDYKRAFGEIVIPSVEKFAPQFILASAGYDSHVNDPLGGMRMTTGGYRWIMRSLCDLANGVCGGRLAATLEGGYDLTALRECAEAQLEEMVSV